MSFTELKKSIPMITPKGPGRALAVIDYSEEHNLIWVVAQDSGEIWSFQNYLVRLQSNVTMGRDIKKPSIYERMADRQRQQQAPLQTPRQWHAVSPDVNEALIQAANDAHLFGLGIIQYTLGDDGSVQVRRLEPKDVTIHTTGPKEEHHDVP